ncbi:MAG TPA: hypothetical protein PLX85_00565 [Dehalococcoidia bacterium]|mgnify:CR=1 FL=1|nr:hypothetical protein [Dehalococcoidia bacterium]
MSEILQQRHVEVAAQGEIVTMAIGNVRWSLEFDLALLIASGLRHFGRIAKLCAGDQHNFFAMSGVLVDLNAPKPRRKRWGEALPERLRKHDVTVNHRGQLVTLRIGRHTVSFPYAEAQKVAKWLRLRGKQARNAANERAHWSRIAPMEAFA